MTVVGDPDVMERGALRLRRAVDTASELGREVIANRFLRVEAGLVREAVVRVHGVALDLDDLAGALRRAGTADGSGTLVATDDEAFAQLVEDGSGTVMSYNIGRGAEGSDGAEQDELEAVAAAIAAGGADVVSLQEVHEDDLPILLAYLEEEYGIVYDVEFTPTLDAAEMAAYLAEQWAEGADPEDLDDRQSPFGIAVLSRRPIEDPTSTELPGGGEDRAVQSVTTEVGGQDVTVVNTHLSTDDADPGGPQQSEQDRQTEALFDAAVAAAATGPVVVTGDLNQTPDELAENAQGYGLDGRVDVANDKDTPTHGGDTIDYVLTSPDIGVVGADVPDEDVSDHRPVLVDVDLTP